MKGVDDEGITAVLGTVLLVGITALLAASVFVAVRVLSDGDRADRPPVLAFAKDGEDPQIEVVRAEAGLDWFEDVVVDGSCAPILNGASFPSAPGQEIRAGDVLRCSTGEDLVISTSANQQNALLYQAEF